MICEICNKEFKQLGTHLRLAHKLTPEEYYEKYIGVGRCKICGKRTKFISLKKGWTLTCCREHQYEYQKTDECVDKVKVTSREKYGTDFPSQANVVKDKIKATNKDKYGVEWACQLEHVRQANREYIEENLDDFLNSIAEGTIKSLGVQNAFMSDEIKKKCRETMKERYGVEYAMQNDTIKEKAKQTFMKNLGVEYPLSSMEVREKCTQTCIERYGVDNAMKLEETKAKVRATSIERYGVSHWTKLPEHRNAVQERYKKQALDIIDVLSTKLNFEFIEFDPNYKGFEFFYINCGKCGKKSLATINYNLTQPMGVRFRCLSCNPPGSLSASTSKVEAELGSFLVSEGINIIKRTKKIISPYEVDFYMQDYSLAVEFDGLYWHSDNYKDRNYHLMKTELCESKGIHLIHVFEDEWNYKQDIIKSILKAKIGKGIFLCGARDVTINRIGFKTKSRFLQANHRQGNDISKYFYGAYFGGRMVGCMTFSRGSLAKGQIKQDGVYELSRFCNLLYYYIPGLFSKMLKYAIKDLKPKRIISFADRRFTYINSNVYLSNGFKLDKITAPNYWYFDDDKLCKHRFSFRKSELANKLDTFDPNKTEVQNMKDNGWFRIFDCGNLRYELCL